MPSTSINPMRAGGHGVTPPDVCFAEVESRQRCKSGWFSRQQSSSLFRCLREQSRMSILRQFATNSRNGPTSCSSLSLAIEPAEK
jgi:hypothetical protein